MSIFQIPLGMNVKNNPLVYSLYDQGEDNNIYPPSPQKNLLTEGGVFLLTEGNFNIDTE